MVDPNAAVSPAESNTANNTCSDTVVVTPPAPDLVATKSDDIIGSTTLGKTWHWSIKVTNNGTATASFNSTDPILVDNLPGTNITYPGG